MLLKWNCSCASRVRVAGVGGGSWGRTASCWEPTEAVKEELRDCSLQGTASPEFQLGFRPRLFAQ